MVKHISIVGLCVACCLGLAIAAEPTNQERQATLAWFSKLGYPDVEGKPFAKVATGHWSKSGDEPAKNHYEHGFVLSDADGKFTVFTLNRQTNTFEKTPVGTAEHERVGYEVVPLTKFVGEYLRAKRELAKLSEEERFRRVDPFNRKSEPGEAVTLAWACWRQGQEPLAIDVYDFANGLEREGERKDWTLRRLLSEDLAHAEMWSTIVDFGNLETSRKALHARLERIVKLFPESEHTPRAKETLAILKQMIHEDEQHAAKSKEQPPLEKLPTKEKVAELIFRLRDQNGHQRSQPGACDIFNDFFGGGDKGATPAHLLVEVGYDAVPQLIEALDDKRFTRSVGFHRNFYFSHHVLTIGDASEQILRRIAGRDFYVARTTSGSMHKDGKQQSTKELVQAWYDELQKKGEEQTLLDAVAEGTDNSDQLADRLLDKYPGPKAIAAIRTGISKSEDYVRGNLIGHLERVPGEEVDAILLAELAKSPEVYGRVSAAHALHRRKRPAAIAAMLKEWQTLLTEKQEKRDRDLEQIGQFLAHSGNEDAIRTLHRSFAKLHVNSRLNILDDLDGEVLAAAPEKTQTAIYALFATALGDTEQRTGIFGSRGDKSFREPRICDYAGMLLNEHDAKRFDFDIEAPFPDRESARLKLREKLTPQDSQF